jgi:lysophospholipase L1-like esterase
MDSAILSRVNRKFGAENQLQEFSHWLVGWLTAGKDCLNPSGLPCLHGDGVANWGQRVSEQDFVQATVAAQPIYRTDEKFPYVRFDGNDDWLECTNGFGTGVSAGLYMVARFTQTIGVRVPIGSADTATANFVWAYLDAGNVPRLDVRRDNNQATDDRWQIFGTREFHRDVLGIYTLYDDGTAWVSKMRDALGTQVAITGVNAGNAMWGSVAGRDNWTLGALKTSAAAASFEGFDLFECIWLDPYTAERAAVVEEYLFNKYRQRVIAHLGDSWAADTGYGIELRAALRSQWIASVNHGIGSETMAQIRARFDTDVTGKGYDLVLVEGSINDFTAGTAAETVFADFQHICDTTLAEGVKLIACNCGPFGNNASWTRARHAQMEAYNQRVANYCRDKAVPLVDLWGFGVNKDQAIRNGSFLSSADGQSFAIAPHWELFGGLHFNAAGDPFVARMIAEVVTRTLNQVI